MRCLYEEMVFGDNRASRELGASNHVDIGGIEQMLQIAIIKIFEA